MSMSRDRVHFILPYCCGSRDVQVQQAAMYAFSMTSAEAFKAMQASATIICRPSQFARFLIKRDEIGGVNDFKDLKAVLVPGEPDVPQVNVSKRDHNG